MKRIKVWTIVAFAAVIASGILMAFATQGFNVVPIEPSQIGEPPQRPQPPENATLIPELSSIPFDLSLNTSEITVSKGESVNITVMIYSTERVDLLLVVGPWDHVPSWGEVMLIGPPELPPGIVAYFGQIETTEISVEANSSITMNLTLSVENQAASGTYTLGVSAIQQTSHGCVSASVPLHLIIL